MYHLDQFQDGPVPTMKGVLLLEFGQGILLKSRIDAPEARFEDGAENGSVVADIEPAKRMLEDDPDLAGVIAFERKRWAAPHRWPEMLVSVQEMRARRFVTWPVRARIVPALNCHNLCRWRGFDRHN